MMNRNTYRVLVEKPEGRKPLGRPKCRQEDIKLDLKGIKLEGLDWIYVAQGGEGRRTLLKTLVTFWFKQNAAIFWLSEGQSASEVVICCVELATQQLVKSAREMTNGIINF
jgi:hypothetical protein